MIGGHERVSTRRQRFAATFVLPGYVADRIRRGLDEPDALGPVLQGLRQWLRLRILTKEPMGMPSVGVGAALEAFLACRGAASEFYEGVTGRPEVDVSAARGVPAAEAAAATMALTWAMACNDQHRRADAPNGLPSLFTADSGLGSGVGWKWTMYCRHEPCTAVDHCVHHDLLPHLPASIPKQVRFDLPPRYPLVDKSDDLGGRGLGSGN